jgi:methyl acetate hydrolase
MLVLAFALLLAGFAQETRTPDATELDRLLRAAVDRRQVPAVVAVVAGKARILYQGAVGLQPDAILAIASMTKPVTSVAVMQLVEAGKVRLDEPAQTYVPELRRLQVLEGGVTRAPKSPPTVRQLLMHTSGFAYEFTNREIANYVRAGKLPSAFGGGPEFLRAPLVADPGTRFEYGIGTDWAGRVVEAVSGQSLDAYFRAHIFAPLRMSDTAFDVLPEKRGRVAPQYAKKADGSLAPTPAPPQPPKPSTFYSGGGGLNSTAADYITFARALLAGGALDGRRILKSESVAAMGRDQLGALPLSPIVSLNPEFIVSNVAMPGSPDTFGLGFALNRKPLPSGRGAKTMSWAGVFNTFFWIDREQDVCAVVMTQMLPFGDAGAVKLVEDFDRAVYQLYRRTAPARRTSSLVKD